MIGHCIDVTTIGPGKVAAQLQVVGRIGKDHVDAGVGQAAHRLDAVAAQDLADRQSGARVLTTQLLRAHGGGNLRPFPDQYLRHACG